LNILLYNRQFLRYNMPENPCPTPSTPHSSFGFGKAASLSIYYYPHV
jgi:hypothetical protein